MLILCPSVTGLFSVNFTPQKSFAPKLFPLMLQSKVASLQYQLLYSSVLDGTGVLGQNAAKVSLRYRLAWPMYMYTYTYNWPCRVRIWLWIPNHPFWIWSVTCQHVASYMYGAMILPNSFANVIPADLVDLNWCLIIFFQMQISETFLTSKKVFAGRLM